MPPEDSVRAFVLIFSSLIDQSDANKYWSELGKGLYSETKDLIKPNDEVKAKATEIAGSSTAPEEVIGKLYQYVRSQIKNISNEASGFTDEQREKVKENKQPSDTLKRGMGNSLDVLRLFASLAKAKGFETRIAFTGDRSDFFFSPALKDQYFLRGIDVAIKVGNEWKFYDPASPYVPLGMLNWQEEENDALIPDPKEPQFVQTPLSPADKSLGKRKANLKLNEDGTIEGDVVIEYTGHLAAEHKNDNDHLSSPQREETLKEMLKAQMSTAEITRIQIDNVTDYDKPFTYRFHIRVPGYGQRTGKRLFFQPAFFQKGITPVFTTNQRKHQVYFHYPWSELDEVDISMPEGFKLENPEGPLPINARETGKHELRIMVSDDQEVVRCIRNFFFGSKDNLLFDADQYAPLKRLFDSFHEADNHTLILRQTVAQ